MQLISEYLYLLSEQNTQVKGAAKGKDLKVIVSALKLVINDCVNALTFETEVKKIREGRCSTEALPVKETKPLPETEPKYV